MGFFDIGNVAFSAAGYAVSYLELAGLVSGLIAVALSSRAHILSWPAGIINVFLSFFLFYQVQLYPDMFLQIFFFVTNIAGWWRWLHPREGEGDHRNQLRISFLGRGGIAVMAVACVGGTVLMGLFASDLHTFAPRLFNKPSAFPYLDSFIMVLSILATFYMIRKKVECWILWILVDMVATFLYFKRDLLLYTLLYFVYCFIATYGLYHWVREYRSYAHNTVR